MQYHREFLLGRWFRQDTDEHNRKVIEYAEFSADGSFEFTFVILAITVDKKEQIIEQITELGDWGLVGDIHFTITKDEVIDEQIYAADLNHSENYHAYRVLQLSHQLFEYQHVETKEVFKMRRINDEIGHC
ncbi:MAG: hypothetical protein QF552_13355 [Litorilituus sp.]|jgi:hypothetical protein|nr:hypothetical protein [Litorilituus sp.]